MKNVRMDEWMNEWMMMSVGVGILVALAIIKRVCNFNW